MCNCCDELKWIDPNEVWMEQNAYLRALSRGTAGLNRNVMNKVRAKFKCYEIAEFQSGKYVKSTEGKDVWTPCKALKFKFQIVSGGSPENDHFYAVSGGSNLELQTINENVFDKFKVGGEYYADLIDASTPVTDPYKG
jgi:hypothetical protein